MSGGSAPANLLETNSLQSEAESYRSALEEGGAPLYRLDLFLDQLRSAQLEIGPREHIRVRRLLLRLAQMGQSPRTFSELGDWIAPLIATSPEQQARIHIHCAEADESLRRNSGQSRNWLRLLRIVLMTAGAIAIAGLVVKDFISRGPAVSQLPVEPSEELGSSWQLPDFPAVDLSLSGIVRLLAALVPLAFALYVMRRGERQRAVIRREEAPASNASAPDADDKRRRTRFYRGARAAFARRTPAGALSRLRLRRETSSLRLDEAGTVELAARRYGLVTRLVYGKRSISVSHLVLISRSTPGDHLGALGDILVERLRQAEVPVEAWDFQNDPTRLTPVGAVLSVDLKMTVLSELAARREGDLLAIVSDGVRFLHPVTREPAPWVAELAGFAGLALFTPVPPRDWGIRERALAEAGFRLFPANADGVAEYAAEAAQWTEDADSAAQVGPIQVRARRRIVAVPERFVYGPEPARDEIDRLMFELESLLEPEAFELLCALGCAPVTDPELTLFLGAALRDKADRPLLTEARLTELARLAWLREGYMPLWFCRELMRRLPAQRFAEVKRAIVAFIDDPESETAFGPDGMPAGPGFALVYEGEGFVARAEAALRRIPRRDPRRDRLYLKFVEAEDKDALDIEIRPPDSGAERRASTRRRARQLAPGVLLGLIIYAAWPSFVAWLSQSSHARAVIDPFVALSQSELWLQIHGWTLIGALTLWALDVRLKKRLRDSAISSNSLSAWRAKMLAGSASLLAALLFLVEVIALGLALVTGAPRAQAVVQSAFDIGSELVVSLTDMAFGALAIAGVTAVSRVPSVPADVKNLFLARSPGRLVFGVSAANVALGALVWLVGIHRDLSAETVLLAGLTAGALLATAWAFQPAPAGADGASGAYESPSTMKIWAWGVLLMAGAVAIAQGLLRPLLGSLYAVADSRPSPSLLILASFGLLAGWTWLSTRVHFALALASIAVLAVVSTVLDQVGMTLLKNDPSLAMTTRALMIAPFAMLIAAAAMSFALWREGAISPGRMLGSVALTVGAWLTGILLCSVAGALAMGVLGDVEDFGGLAGMVLFAYVIAPCAIALGSYFIFVRNGLQPPPAKGPGEARRGGPAGLLFIPVFWLVAFTFQTMYLRADLSALSVPLAAYVAWRFGRWGFYAVLVGGLYSAVSFWVASMGYSGSLGQYALMVAVARIFGDEGYRTRVLQPRKVAPWQFLLVAVMFGAAWASFPSSAGLRLVLSAEPYSYYFLFIMGLSGAPWRALLSTAAVVGALSFGAHLFGTGAGAFAGGHWQFPVNTMGDLLWIPLAVWLGHVVRSGKPGAGFWASEQGLHLLLALGVAQTVVSLQVAAFNDARVSLTAFHYASPALLAFVSGMLYGWRGFRWSLAIAVVLGFAASAVIATLGAMEIVDRAPVTVGWIRYGWNTTFNTYVPLAVIALAWLGARTRENMAGHTRGASPAETPSR